MRLRFRRAGSDRRSRPGRHGGRHLARFRSGVRRHRSRRHHGVAHHQRRRRHPDRHVSRHGGEARLRHCKTARHRAERHSERVHRPRHLGVPGRSVGEARRRHHRVLRQGGAEIFAGERLRLSHPRIRRDAGGGNGLRLRHRQGLYRRGAGARPRHRRVRRPAVVQLQHFRQSVRAGGEIPRRPAAVGENHPRRLWRQEAGIRLAAHDRRRRRFRAHHRAAGKQHHARRLLCADRGARRRADHGAVLLRRGLYDPDAEGAAHLAAHHAASDRRDRARRHRRSARRLLLHREPDQSARGKNRRGDELGRFPRRHRQGGEPTA